MLVKYFNNCCQSSNLKRVLRLAPWTCVAVWSFFCSSLSRKQGRWFWVGLNKRDPEYPGAWEWSDGSLVSPLSSPLMCLLYPHLSPDSSVTGFCVVQVVTSFIEDKNEEDDRRDCAVYSDLTNVLTPQPCDTKHEWVCKLPRGDHPHPHYSPHWITRINTRLLS